MDLKPENSCRSGEYIPADEENLTVRDLLAGLDPGDLKICLAFLQQCIGNTGLDYRNTGFLNVYERRISLPGLARNRFVKILSRLVKGQEGLSRWEIAFIRQIWHEYLGDREDAIGSPLPKCVGAGGANPGNRVH